MISRIPRVLQMLWLGSVLSTSDIPVQLWWPGRFEAQGLPGFITQADLGEFHGTPRLPASPARTARIRPVGHQELADPPLLAHQHPASRTFAGLGCRGSCVLVRRPWFDHQLLTALAPHPVQRG
jgi:hypothetical protein